MKSLANCAPTEFMTQTNKIRKSVEKWLKLTDIMNIRKHAPKYEPIPANGKNLDEINARNAEKKFEQAKANLSAMMDAIFEEHPTETLEILALCCFVEPKDVDSHTMREYLEVFNDLINDEVVIRFFTSLVRLAQTSMGNA